jgi:hypothetical protein
MVGYQLPSMEKMRNSMLPKIAAATKEKALQLLKTCTSFNIILDIWSSKQMMGYIGFKCQAVTLDYELVHVFLAMKHMTGRHTAANVFAEYEQTIADWNIPVQCVGLFPLFSKYRHIYHLNFSLFQLTD